MTYPKISIIITSYKMDRINDIYQLLDSIHEQKYKNIETIFVAERLPELVNRISEYVKQKQMPNVVVLYNNGPSGLSAARNVGIKQAKGDYISFLDDDVVLFPEWAAATIKAFEDQSVAGVTGPAVPLWENESMSWFPDEFTWIMSCTNWSNYGEKAEVRNAWGMNMSFRKEALEQSGLFSNDFGYHQGSMAEDNEISLRVREKTGKKIIYVRDTMVWHRVYEFRLTFKFIRERSLWIGRSRRMIRRTLRGKRTKGGTLRQETRLLKRIIINLMPKIFLTFFTKPSIAWRKLKVTLTILWFVGRGYCFPSTAENI
jgi:glucosyl-dolichyl phosphate glucuronosyltransferase